MDLKQLIKGHINQIQAEFFVRVSYINRLANLGEIPLGVSAKSLLTLQCGVPCARQELLPFSSMMTSITLYARTKARATSDELDILFFFCFYFVFVFSFIIFALFHFILSW
jgi:hypothetical protein